MSFSLCLHVGCLPLDTARVSFGITRMYVHSSLLPLGIRQFSLGLATPQECIFIVASRMQATITFFVCRPCLLLVRISAPHHTSVSLVVHGQEKLAREADAARRRDRARDARTGWQVSFDKTLSKTTAGKGFRTDRRHLLACATHPRRLPVSVVMLI